MRAHRSDVGSGLQLLTLAGALGLASGCSEVGTFALYDNEPTGAQAGALSPEAPPAPAHATPVSASDHMALEGDGGWRPGARSHAGGTTTTTHAFEPAFSSPLPPSSAGADAAVSLYGELPHFAAATGEPGNAFALDTMDGLHQETDSAEGVVFDPSVTRDGRWMVFASTQHRPTADIYLKPLTGRTLTQLTADPAHDVMPAVSPDGRRIAFASNRNGSWDIFIMPFEGGQAVQVTNDSAAELHPSWSSDGTKLVYCRLGSTTGRWEMWVVNPDRPVGAEFIGYGLFPEWCPRAGTGLSGGDRILFQRSRERGSREFSIWTLDYTPGDASMPTEIVTGRREAVINPTWSPDGRRVVFASVPVPMTDATGDTRPASADLWMVNIDGTNRVNLTSGRFVNLMPTWAPDDRIYFVSDRSGRDNIWSVDTDRAILAMTGERPDPNEGVTAVPTAP